MEMMEEIEIKIEYNEVIEEDPFLDNSITVEGFNNCLNDDYEEQVDYQSNGGQEDSSSCTELQLKDDNVHIISGSEEVSDKTLLNHAQPEHHHLWPVFYTEKKSWKLTNPIAKEDCNINTITWYREIDSEGKLYCKYCDLSYSIIQTLRYHVRTKHPKEAAILKEEIAKLNRCQKLMCHICDTKYLTVEHLKNHVMSKHSFNTEERFLCDHCLTMFYRKSELERHIKDEHFNKKHIARVKKNNHSNAERKRKFQCPYCSHMAKRKFGLKTHIKAKHKSEADLTYACFFCPYKASIKYYLQNHISTKHPESDFARSKVCHFCDVCGYRTPKKSHFIQHRNSHFSVEKKHKCEFCDYATNLFANLEVHRRKHTKEKPYACDADGCDYRCSAKTALNSHKLKHDPDKHAVYCDQCNYKTVYKHALKKHRESHDRTSFLKSDGAKQLFVKRKKNPQNDSSKGI